MALMTVIETVDDFTGEPGAKTYTFALGQLWYEVDLVDDAPLREALAPFVRVGRRHTEFRGEQRTEILHWARERGYNLSTRGRIPSAVIEEFLAR